jgi:mono/diheme cytochrome c family protein
MTVRFQLVLGTLAAALLLTVALPARTMPQTVAAATQTTLDGVYSAAQATRGDGTFSSLCTGCHTAASFKGGTFLAWADVPLAELFLYLTEAMPEDAPGSLTAAEYADIIAFLLKANGMPAGTEDLKADTATLGKITIKFRDR